MPDGRPLGDGQLCASVVSSFLPISHLRLSAFICGSFLSFLSALYK